MAIRSRCRCCFLSVGGQEPKGKASSPAGELRRYRHVCGGRRQVDAEGTVAHGLAHFQSAVPVVTQMVLPSGKVWWLVYFALAQLTCCKGWKVHIPE